MSEQRGDTQADPHRVLEDPGAGLLIINDDEGILELLAAYGCLNGWHVAAASSLGTALKVLNG